MVSGETKTAYKYDLTSPKFKTAFSFLERKDLSDLPEGWIELDNGVRASIQHYNSFEWSEGKFETHEKYFDIQYVIEGMEYIGVCERKELGKTVIPYSESEDIEFYEEPKYSSRVFLNAGDYVILAPEDAHKPRTCVDKPIAIKKVVLKVPV